MADGGIAGFAPGYNPELGGGSSGAVATRANQAGYVGPNTVSIILDGKTVLSGWIEVRLETYTEHCPNLFQLTVTERLPDNAAEVILLPGMPCTVMVDNDPIVTGFIDRYEVLLDAHQHLVRITGRGKTEDIVDSSALLHTRTLPAGVSGTTLPSGTVLQVAQALCDPYGITVTGTDSGAMVPQINITLGQTVYELIEMIARWDGRLVYEDSSGQLVLGVAGGAGTMSSGIQQAVNLQRAAVNLTMDERFHDYYAKAFNVAPVPMGTGASTETATWTDTGAPGPPRLRQLVVIGENMNQGGAPFNVTLAVWEGKRRAGRSFQIRALIDSWRDSAGRLWAPNAFISVDVPAAKISSQNWVIGQVIFIRDIAGGTTAELHCMPPDAFMPQPELLSGIYPAIAAASQPGGAGNVGATPSPSAAAPVSPGTPAAAGGSSAAGVQGLPGSPSGPPASRTINSPGVQQP